jgi:hypothetical protein
MSDVNWSDEALRLAADLARRPGRPERGVMVRTEHTGVYAVFAPGAEGEGLKDRLAAAGIELLGSPGVTPTPSGGTVFAQFVRTACHPDRDQLTAIVNGEPPAGDPGCAIPPASA